MIKERKAFLLYCWLNTAKRNENGDYYVPWLRAALRDIVGWYLRKTWQTL